MRDRKIVYYYKGISLRRWCKENNKNAPLIIKYRRLGFSINEALLKADEVQKNKNNINLRLSKELPKGYKNLGEFCRINGYKYTRVSYRLSIGKSLKEAISDDKYFSKIGNPKHNLYYKGMSCKRYCETHVYKCYSYNSFLKRWKSGLSIQEALFGGKYKGKIIDD